MSATLLLTLAENVQCCICGTGASPNPEFSPGKHMSLYLPDSDFRKDDMYYSNSRCERLDGRPLCYECDRQWQLLDKKLGRDSYPEEFLLIMLSRMTKKAKKQNWESLVEPPSQRPTIMDFSAVIWDDFAQVLAEELGKKIRIVCADCGERCGSAVSTHS